MAPFLASIGLALLVLGFIALGISNSRGNRFQSKLCLLLGLLGGTDALGGMAAYGPFVESWVLLATSLGCLALGFHGLRTERD